MALPTRDSRAGEDTNEGGSDRCAAVDDDDDNDDDSNKAIKIEAADVMMDEHDVCCACRYGT